MRSVLADTSAGPVDLVVVDNGSADGSVDALRAARPRRAYRPLARQRRLRARREPRHRRDARADHRGAQSRPDRRARNGRRARRPARAASRVSARPVHASATSTAPTIPRRGALPSDPRRRRSRAARPVVADEPLHRALPPARRRSRRRRRAVDWVSGARGVAAARRARRGRRLGRALLHVHRGRRPVLADAAARAGRSRTSPTARSCTCRVRGRVGGPTGCCSSTIGRRGRFARRRLTGIRACCSRLLRFT